MEGHSLGCSKSTAEFKLPNYDPNREGPDASGWKVLVEDGRPVE